jgi:hypothetical protein
MKALQIIGLTALAAAVIAAAFVLYLYFTFCGGGAHAIC